MKVTDLSIAISTLNRPAGLVQCLDALLGSETKPAQIIIVDQSEDDSTEALVKQRQGRAIEIVYLRRPQHGLSASRNAGISCVSCPVVAFTDDDCVPDSGWIAAIGRTFASPAAPDAMTGRVLPLGQDEPGTYAVSSRRSTARADFSGRAIPWVVGTGGNLAVKRQWFDRIGTYDERLGAGAPGKAAEDADLIYRLLKAGARIRYEPDAVIYHMRQGRERRLSSRWGYGYGIGAFCGMWLRRGDLYSIDMLTHWLFIVFRQLAGMAANRKWLEAHQAMLSLRGTLHGLAYGFSAR